jgi:hypothetical protein
MDKEAIFKKLKFGLSDKNLIVNAPAGYLTILEGAEFDVLPDQARLGEYGFIQVFASFQTEMELLIKSVAKSGKHDCLFWACYPKSVGKQKYDLNRDSVWPALALAGLRPVSQIAINEK